MSEQSNSTEPLRYPVNRIEKENSDFLKIMILTYQPPNPEKVFGEDVFNIPGAGERYEVNRYNPGNAIGPERIVKTILLPIPQSIQDSNGVRWGEDQLNPLAAAGLRAVNDTITAENITTAADKARNSISESAKAIGNTGRNLTNLFFGSQIVNALGGNTSFQGLVSRTTGQVLNPNLELLFNGVTLRSFSFDFDLVPRDERESKEIRRIIRTLKQNMSAKGGSSGDYNKGLFIKSPNIFQLVYSTGNETHSYLNRFKPMALKNMSVNYTGSGTYATYTNTSPVHYKLNLQFQEIDPIYAEDYNIILGVGGQITEVALMQAEENEGVGF
tara:strand:+ start:195 stop:1181 length:987 start_codon:yes stop_codon:yes gene_type:complete